MHVHVLPKHYREMNHIIIWLTVWSCLFLCVWLCAVPSDWCAPLGSEAVPKQEVGLCPSVRLRKLHIPLWQVPIKKEVKRMWWHDNLVFYLWCRRYVVGRDGLKKLSAHLSVGTAHPNPTLHQDQIIVFLNQEAISWALRESISLIVLDHVPLHIPCHFNNCIYN